MKFWLKELWPPYSPDANPLDYAFGGHIERKACRVHHPNVGALKKSVDEHWAAMSPDVIKKCCSGFRKKLQAIIAAEGSYIEK